jgi:hypothetical protein
LIRLDAAGVPATFSRLALPSWWDDEIAESKSGLQQAHMYLARAFHIDLTSLAQPQGPVKFRSAQGIFNPCENVTHSNVGVSAHFAAAMAKLALVGLAAEQMSVPKDCTELQNAILKKHPSVSLSALLTWCAEASIPVLHIPKLPSKKMSGVVVHEDGRFAIVLYKNRRPARKLFHLAHGLGLIASGHLLENGFVAEAKAAHAYAKNFLNFNEGHDDSVLSHGNSGKLVNKMLFSTLNGAKYSDDQLDLLKEATGYST